MTQRHPLYFVDAFTHEPFHGNPAAVCLLRKAYPDEVLQAVGAEMNLSETAFVRAEGDDLFGAHRFALRWFSPTTEVALCGHATLAAAKVLFDELGIAGPEIPFDTRSGVLTARSAGHRIALDFPRNDPVTRNAEPDVRGAMGGTEPEGLLEAPAVGVWLVRYASEDHVRQLRPDIDRVGRLPADVIVVTAPGSGGHDFVSRVFAPRLGIPEDPVTGMAHTVLGPYWATQLGRTRFRAFQASRRGGEVGVELSGSDRVTLTGEARIVLRGYLDLPS